MPQLLARWARRSGLAIVLVLTSAAGAAAMQDPIAAPPSAVVVTERDIAASNAKIGAAFSALAAMWTADFDRIGARFVVPSVVRFRGPVRTACGFLRGDNALYCPSRNVIYFDEVFVARQAKIAAQELGTDGDMAAIGIIAHEVGHAVAMQVGEDSPVPYRNEATADCLAGAFAQRAKQDGSLEKGDLEEAFFGMAAAGDPPLRLSGDPRYDARLVRMASMTGHGSRDQRQQNFRSGYEGGAGACLAEFR
ncbi:MAG TPA: neutral zinc metallopeptidase [Gemmatimonadaceae bacterium]